MKNETRNIAGDFEWIPVDERVGKEYSGSDDFADDVVKEDNMENELKKGDDGWTEIGQPVGEANDNETFLTGKFHVGDVVSWKDENDEMQDGWTVVGYDEISLEYHLKKDDKDVFVDDVRVEEYNESKVNEAQVVVDANDVWDVLELLDDETAKKNLTDLINSHLRTEDEIMDAIEGVIGDMGITSTAISKSTLNGMFASENIHELISMLDLDVDAYMDKGVIQDAGKPTSVELEGIDWKDLTEKLDANELADSLNGWEDSSKKLVVCDAYASGSEIVNVDVLTVTDKRDEVMKMANDYLLGNVENWQVSDASEPRKDENGQFYTELILEPKYEEVSENNDEVKSGDVKDGEKQVTQDGETKTLVAGEEKKPVCEMTIEQEVPSPQALSNMLWGQGKENLEELLRADVVDGGSIMQMLEDMGLRNLTEINDFFSFDFENVLESLGLDAEAWSQNLEIKRKGEYDSDED